MKAHSQSDFVSLHAPIVCGLLVLLWLLTFSQLLGAQTVPLQELDRLQDQLQRFGWQTERGAAGDLIIRPPAEGSIPPQERTEATSRPGPPNLIPATDIHLLAARLQEHGWSVERDGTGALLVYSEGAAAPEAGGVSGSVTSRPGESNSGDALQDLHALLKASGWQVSRDAAGDLVVAPGGKTTSLDQRATVSVDTADLADAKEVLVAAGWQLQEGHNGSLLLYPGKGNERSVTAAAARPAGQLQSPIVRGDVQLPIDSWREAKTMAEYWLRQQGLGDRLVGRIRKVNWIYLVSIVERDAPHRLHDQIAIRISDGTILSLFH